MAHDSVEYTQSVQEVRRVIDDWRNAVNAGDIDQILQIVADDFEIMPPGQPLSGAGAREFLQEFVKQFRADLQPFRNEEIIMCGEWAIQRLTYEITLTPKGGGDAITERGDGFHMFRRDGATGSWRLVKDISTSVPATSAEA
jgi:ketosteroid isomerase-like protein